MADRLVVVRRRSERASALLLLPAAIMILLVLAAFAVDGTHHLLARRQLAGAAAAAANDAVTAGLDESAFRTDGAFVLDPERVDRVVRAALDATGEPFVASATVTVTIEPGTPASPPRVTVTLRARSAAIFASAIPGVDGATTIEASATATAIIR